MRVCLIFFLILINNSIIAQTFTWTGAGDGTSWHDAANWDQMAVPSHSFHHVIIQNASNVQTTNHSQCRSLRLINSKLTTASAFNFFITFTKTTATDSVVFYAKNSVIKNSSNFRIITQENNFAMVLDESLLTNTGSGRIDIPSATSGIRTTTSSKLINQAGGKIILDVTDRAMVLNDSLYNEGLVQLDYDKVGLLSQGFVDNRDSIILTGHHITADTGAVFYKNFKNQGFLSVENNNLLGIKYLGNFENLPQGEIKILNTNNTGQVATALYFRKNTVNNGKIYIHNVDGFGIYNENNTAGFDNNGEIELLAIDSTGISNIHSGLDTVIFRNTGVILINYAHLGLRNSALGKVRNTGKIECLQAFDGIVNHGVIINLDSITLNGDSYLASSNIGFKNEGKFLNQHYLEIKFYLKYGLQSQETISNGASALLYLNSCGNTTGGGALYTNGLLLNYGEIRAEVNIGADIINDSNLSGFYNFGHINLLSTAGLGIINASNTSDSSFFYNAGPLNFNYQSLGTIPYPERGILWNHSKGSFKSTAKITFDELYLPEQIAILNQSFFLQADSIIITRMAGVQIKNTGQFISNKYLLADASGNDFNKVIINSGYLTLVGKTDLNYQPGTPKIRNHLVENTGTLYNKSYWLFDGNYNYGGIVNSGVFNNDSTIVFMNLDKTAFQNTGSIYNNALARILVDFETTASTVDEAIFINEGLLSNAGEININRSSNRAFWLKNGGKIINSQLIKITEQRAQAFYLETAVDSVLNLPNATIDIDSVNFSASFLLNGNAIRMLNGYFENKGNLYLKKIKNRAIEITGGKMLTTGVLNIEKAYEWDVIWLANSNFSNAGHLSINGASVQNLRAVFVNTTATFDNSFGKVTLIDQAGIGLRIQGSFMDTGSSIITFTNNTRNTGSLFEDQTSNTLVYKGSMSAQNSRYCALFDDNAITEGYLDLRNCTLGLIHQGTNAIKGHIQVADNVLPKINYGLVELSASTRLAPIEGGVVWTNYGIINDKTNGLVNVRFYQTATPPIYPLRNEGLFISPFYGRLSEGIKETTNLIFTSTATLPLSLLWYSDRAKTQTVGDWHATDHYFTPNAQADAADSLFVEFTPAGGTPTMLGIPHLKPGTCPNPPVERSLSPSLDYNWNKPGTWLGNRIPDYCDKVILSGNEGLYVPAGYKAKINTLDFTPQPGNGRFFEIKTGAVMEINALPYN